jgi:septum site-determining protein MinD
VGFADFSTDAIREMISKGRSWEIQALQRILRLRKALINGMKFDVCIVDTSPGIQYLSINAVVAADVSVVVSTMDDSDIDGTTRMIKELYDVFEKKTAIVINKAIGHSKMEKGEKILEGLDEKYRDAVIGVLPCFCEVGMLKRSSIFVLDEPKHPFTEMLQEIAHKLNTV